MKLLSFFSLFLLGAITVLAQETQSDTTRAELLQALAARDENPDAHRPLSLFLAVEDGTCFGCLTLVTFPIPTGIRAWIEDVVVDEKARGKGAGSSQSTSILYWILGCAFAKIHPCIKAFVSSYTIVWKANLAGHY